MMKNTTSAIEIRVWMLRSNMNRRKIAKAYKVTEQFVGQFLNRERTSKGMVEFFIKRGCPEKYFKNGKVAE